MKFIIIDLNTAMIDFAVVKEDDADGQVEKSWHIATDLRDNGERVLPQLIQDIAHELNNGTLARSEIQGIEMAVLGEMVDVDTARGVVVGAPEFGWEKPQFVRDIIEGELGFPVELVTEAHTAVFGE